MSKILLDPHLMTWRWATPALGMSTPCSDDYVRVQYMYKCSIEKVIQTPWKLWAFTGPLMVLCLIWYMSNMVLHRNLGRPTNFFFWVNVPRTHKSHGAWFLNKRGILGNTANLCEWLWGISIIIPCSMLILTSDWQTIMKGQHVPHFWLVLLIDIENPYRLWNCLYR